MYYNTPHKKHAKKQLYRKKNLQVQPTVASTDHRLTHGLYYTTVDEIKNSKKFWPRKICYFSEDGRTYVP